MSGHVYVVVPVFNRWRFTRQCLDDLQQQTYRPLTIIVSDGGSTDDTRAKLGECYPQVRLAYDGKTRWWAGSCALAIDSVLAEGENDDFVLLLNNDTRIPEDYIETLVNCSRRHDAAVGAKIVDSRDPSIVLDAGEFIDWKSYTFSVTTTIAPGQRFCDTVDMLPGRGSLVPLRMIRVAGNIDDVSFPHYISDYDFFCRIRSAGFKLVVCYETAILAHIEETGIIPERGLTFAKAWREVTDRRSMSNIVDHWRFIARHAPPQHRLRLLRKLIAANIGKFVFQTKLGILTVPMLRAAPLLFQAAHFAVLLPGALMRFYANPDVGLKSQTLPTPFRMLAQLTLTPRPFLAEELRSLNLDAEELGRLGVIKPLDEPGWYMFNTLKWPSVSDQQGLRKLLKLCRGKGPNQVRAILAYQDARLSRRHNAAQARGFP